ncbi:MAG: energy transducer TonB [Opitutaceae bacterium]|nr:energy transducer TonB [Opitutaceae bacterium]
MNAFKLNPATPAGSAPASSVEGEMSDAAPKLPASAVRLGEGGYKQRSWISIYAVPAFIAAAAHVGVALSGSKQAPKAASASTDDTAVMVQIMPEVEPLEDEVLVDDSPAPTTSAVESFAPPQLVDVPSISMNADFVQAIQIAAPQSTVTAGLFSVPKGPARPEGIANQMSKVFSLESLDRHPEVVGRSRPIYPADLKRSSIEGVVLVTFIVSNTGEVQEVEVVRSSHPGFELSAVASVRKWRFKPGIFRGQPVATRMEQPIRFELSR